MKKTLSNLKQVNHFIQETEKKIVNIKGWKASMCAPNEKEQSLKEERIALEKHKETKKRILEHLKTEIDAELETLKD